MVDAGRIHRFGKEGHSWTYPPHGVDSGLSNLMFKVVPLDETNAMFPSDSPFHFHGPFHHPMNYFFRHLLLLVIEQYNRCWSQQLAVVQLVRGKMNFFTVKIAVPDVTANSCK